MSDRYLHEILKSNVQIINISLQDINIAGELVRLGHAVYTHDVSISSPADVSSHFEDVDDDDVVKEPKEGKPEPVAVDSGAEI